MNRPVKIVVIQTGPSSPSKQENIKANLRLLESAAKEAPDFVVFPELSTTQYFPTGTTDQRFFNLAEPIPGPATSRFCEKAKEYQCHIILPLFEKGELEGEYYNSAVLIGPSGNIIHGTLPDGRNVKAYRKNHIGLVDFNGFKVTERYYMNPGPGFPVFSSDKGTVGIMICYDRWHPESWRTLALMGAEIIFVPTASCYGSSGGGGDLYLWSFRLWAHENLLFAVGCNKAGVEHIDQNNAYYGLSCVASPLGKTVASGTEAKGPELICATVDLADIESCRRGMPYFRDRRPNIYLSRRM